MDQDIHKRIASAQRGKKKQASGKLRVLHWRTLWGQRQMIIATLAVLGIITNLFLRFALQLVPSVYDVPLLMTLTIGGIPLVR